MQPEHPSLEAFYREHHNDIIERFEVQDSVIKKKVHELWLKLGDEETNPDLILYETIVGYCHYEFDSRREHVKDMLNAYRWDQGTRDYSSYFRTQSLLDYINDVHGRD